jgi:hypothetical protein
MVSRGFSAAAEKSRVDAVHRIGLLHVGHRSYTAGLDGSSFLGRGLSRLGALVSSFGFEAG